MQLISQLEKAPPTDRGPHEPGPGFQLGLGQGLLRGPSADPVILFGKSPPAEGWPGQTPAGGAPLVLS